MRHLPIPCTISRTNRLHNTLILGHNGRLMRSLSTFYSTFVSAETRARIKQRRFYSISKVCYPYPQAAARDFAWCVESSKFRPCKSVFFILSTNQMLQHGINRWGPIHGNLAGHSQKEHFGAPLISFYHPTESYQAPFNSRYDLWRDFYRLSAWRDGTRTHRLRIGQGPDKCYYGKCNQMDLGT